MSSVGVTLNIASPPYLEALDRGALALPRCATCGTWSPPWVTYCPDDDRHELEWVEVAGTGTIAGWTTYHRSYPLVRTRDVPYRVVLVTLDQGVRLAGLLADPLDRVPHRGQPVRWEPQRDEHGPLPAFRTVERP